MRSKQVVRVLKSVFALFMAVLLAVGLMPFPAPNGQAHAADTPLAAGSSAILSAGDGEEGEDAPADAHMQPDSGELSAQAATGKLTYSSNQLNFYLYPGYNGGSETGALKAYTIKNTGSVKVTGIKLANFSAKKTDTIEYDENDTPVTKPNTVPYVLTNEYGSVRYDSNYLEGLSYWADSEKFDLNPGESKKLYFTVASPFRAGYTLKTGISVTDTVQIVSDNTTAKTVNLHCEVYDPNGSYAKFGTGLDSSGNVAGTPSINFGTVAAGTEVFDEDGSYNKYQMFYIQNAATAKDSKRGGYPDLTVTDITIEDDTAGVFQGAQVGYGDGLYGASRMTLGYDSYWPRAYTVDATYVPAGTYTANLCFHLSPYKVNSNAGNTTTGVIKIPMTVKVTGTNPNIPVAVTNLTAEAGNGYVGLSWDRLPKDTTNSSGYVVWRDKCEVDDYGKLGWDYIGEVLELDETTYVDKNVVNDTTYTYYVTPRFGGNYDFVKKSNYASATPSGSAQGRPLAPYIHRSDTQNGSVRLTWSLDPETQHQFDKGDGKGVDYDSSLAAYPAIDHFNIYQDGSLVATYSQNAYEAHYDEMYHFPSGYWESKLSYYWVYDVPVDDAYQYHKFRVSAVTKTGAESYPSIEDEEYSGSDVPLTTRLEASWTQGSGVSLSFGWETETWIEWVGSGISYTVERKEAGASSFQTVRSDRTDDYEASWVDSTAVAGKTYVYRVIGTNSAGVGTSKEVTISTSGASAALPQFGYELWSVTEGTLSASASVWSDNTKVELLRKKDDAADYTVVASKTVSNNSVEFTDTPENGTYTYYMRFSLGGCVDSSQPFVWNRAENISYDNMLKPPGAVTSVTITPGDRKFQFFWDPPATGGKVESYQICEYLEFPDGPSINMDSMQVVPGSETSYLCENTYHNGEWYPPSNGSEYRFVIRAVNAAGVSDWTYLDEVSPNGDDWSTEPPAAPVIDGDNTKVQWSADVNEWVLHIEWMPGDGGGTATGYYATADIPGWGLSGEKTKADELSCDLRMGAQDEAGIKKGTYAIRVAAYNSRAPLGDDWKGGVASSYSYTYGAATAAPLAPRVWADGPSDAAYIHLSLQPAEDDPNAAYVTSYNVYRSESADGSYTQVATVDAAESSAVDYYDTDVTGWGYFNSGNSGWVNSRTYYYKVSAVNAVGASDQTAKACQVGSISNSQRDAARNANSTMASLPDSNDASAVLEAADTIASVRSAYDALTAPARATFVEAANVAKLVACETALASAANRAAAQAVDEQVSALGSAEGIAALLSQGDVDAKAALIAEARAAYDALTTEQLTYVASGTPAALQAAESAIEVAQARTLIAAIPETSLMTVDSLAEDRNKVVNARAAYNALTDTQKAQVDAFGTFNKSTIEAAEAAIANSEALVEVKALIDALPAADDITRDNRAAVADQVATARSAYDALTDAQKAAVGVISKLTEAEARIAALDGEIAAEANVVQVMIDALDAGKVADGRTSVDAAIEAAQEARSAYENLADDAQSRVDATNLEAYETAIKGKQQAGFAAEIAASAAITGDTPIALGGTAVYTATAVDNTTVTWSSGSPSVATVDAETGEVTGVASGTAAIIATYSRDGYDGATLVASVSKQVEVFDVSVTGPDKVVFGSTPRLTLTSSVEGGFTWASSDSRVVSVSQDGTCKALAVGTVVVTAQSSVYPTVVARKTVQVVPAPISISLSATQFMYNGKSQRPAVAVRYAYGTVPAGGYTISWPADTTSAGTKTITVRGVGNYAGTANATYRINMASKQMFRLYNPYSGEHFYTADANERNTLTGLGWRYEGVGWNAPTTGANVYRLYNRFSGDHHFTTDAGEKDACVRAGWTYEGVGWKSGGNVRVYREYNPYAEAFYHNYTASANEHRTLCSIGWKDEGIGWYGV